MSAVTKKLDTAKQTITKLGKKLNELRRGQRADQIALGASLLGVTAVNAGMADGIVNALPGGHFATDYKTAPNPLKGKRFLALMAGAAAIAFTLKGPEARAAYVLAAGAGRAVAIDKATYLKKTGALTPEQIERDIGKDKAALVAAANGYPAK